MRIALLVAVFLAFSAGSASAEVDALRFDVWTLHTSVAIAAHTQSIDDLAATGLTFSPETNPSIPGLASPIRPAHLWIRFIPPAAMTERNGPWYLEASRYLGRGTVYVRMRGAKTWTGIPIGLRIPYAERRVKRALPTVLLPSSLAPGSPIYIDAYADLNLIPITLMNAVALHEDDAETNRTQRLVLIFTGIFLALALCNFLVYAAIREPAYALYSISMLLLALSGPMQSSALAWEMFWPHASLSDMIPRFTAIFGECYISLAFAKLFLRTKDYAPKTARAVDIFMALFPLFFVAGVIIFPSVPLPGLGGADIIDADIVSLLVMWAVVVALGIIGARHRVRGSTAVIIGFAAALIGNAIHIAMTYLDYPLSQQWTYLLPSYARVAEGFVLFFALSSRLHDTIRAHEQERQERIAAQALAANDGLTGIANRRSFDEVLAREWNRCKRSGADLALIMIDVDNFKKYNDRYGHHEGDDVLRLVARTLATYARRPGDLAARYGGEEFAMILPETDLNAAFAIASDLCTAITAAAIPHVENTGDVVSVSCGVASCVPGDSPCESIIPEADDALYRAKTSGRNRAIRSMKHSGLSIA